MRMIPVFANFRNDQNQKAIGHASCLACAADIIKIHFDSSNTLLIPTSIQLSAFLFVGKDDFSKYGVRPEDITHDDKGNYNITGYFGAEFVEKTTECPINRLMD